MKIDGNGYSINAMGDTAEILIYESIGEDFFGGGISAKSFAEDLNTFGDIKKLYVRINSPGGSVFDGNAIYNTLKRHPAKVIVDIDGMALSIASIIAMAGDEVRMAGNGLFMIHNPWTISMGSAADFRKEADLLDKVKETLVTTYVAKTGDEPTNISDMMDSETWFSAEEALSAGFIDSITEDQKMAAHFDLSKFSNNPAGVIADPVDDEHEEPDKQDEETVDPCFKVAIMRRRLDLESA